MVRPDLFVSSVSSDRVYLGSISTGRRAPLEGTIDTPLTSEYVTSYNSSYSAFIHTFTLADFQHDLYRPSFPCARRCLWLACGSSLPGTCTVTLPERCVLPTTVFFPQFTSDASGVATSVFVTQSESTASASPDSSAVSFTTVTFTIPANESTVSATAVVTGTADPSGTAAATGTTEVTGTAVTSGTAEVSGTAVVTGTAVTSGTAEVIGTAVVTGTAVTSGTAVVTGTAATAY